MPAPEFSVHIHRQQPEIVLTATTTDGICQQGSPTFLSGAGQTMPEVRLQLEWPDGQTSEFYSPSTVVLDHLRPGDALSVAELERVGVRALQEASERVRARYGFACTRTDEEERRLRQRLSGYASEATVRVTQRLS